MKETHYEIFCQLKDNLEILISEKELYQDENLFYEFMLDFKAHLYNTIYGVLDPNKQFGENEKYIRHYIKYIIKKILPICNIKIKQFGNPQNNVGNKLALLNNWINLEDDFYAMASFRSMKHFAYYIERDMSKKVWRDTMPIFEGFFNYANKMALTGSVDVLRASYFPGAGKTYGGNILCAFWIGYDQEISILRITYSDDMAKTFTKQIANIIETPRYKKVFPKFNLEPKDLYKTKNSGEIWFNFCTSASFYATTRDGQTTGKRARVIMIDDITKGAKEAYKTEIHKQIVDMFDSDWASRGDDDDQKLVLLGTMWSPYDLLNVVQKRAEKYYEFSRSKTFKYCLIDSEEKNVFIAVPILDYDTDESTCPARYSTEAMRKKRDDYQDKALFNAVYQQQPEAPNELVLDHKNLSHYTDNTIPQEILDGNCECRGMIDPTRRGFDYFAFWICKRVYLGVDDFGNDKFSKWYLVDCIYRRDTAKHLMPMIIDKIKRHNMTRLSIEINTSNELPELINDRLEENNYFDLEINEVFSTQKKEEKIAEAMTGLTNEIIYPDKYMYAETSEMGKAMVDFTTYDIDGNNKHDDFVDCGAMFVKENCEIEQSNEMQVLGINFRI